MKNQPKVFEASMCQCLQTFLFTATGKWQQIFKEKGGTSVILSQWFFHTNNRRALKQRCRHVGFQKGGGLQWLHCSIKNSQIKKKTTQSAKQQQCAQNKCQRVWHINKQFFLALWPNATQQQTLLQKKRNFTCEGQNQECNSFPVHNDFCLHSWSRFLKRCHDNWSNFWFDVSFANFLSTNFLIHGAMWQPSHAIHRDDNAWSSWPTLLCDAFTFLDSLHHIHTIVVCLLHQCAVFFIPMSLLSSDPLLHCVHLSTEFFWQMTTKFSLGHPLEQTSIQLMNVAAQAAFKLAQFCLRQQITRWAKQCSTDLWPHFFCCTMIDCFVHAVKERHLSCWLATASWTAFFLFWLLHHILTCKEHHHTKGASGVTVFLIAGAWSCLSSTASYLATMARAPNTTSKQKLWNSWHPKQCDCELQFRQNLWKIHASMLQTVQWHTKVLVNPPSFLAMMFLRQAQKVTWPCLPPSVATATICCNCHQSAFNHGEVHLSV